MADIKEKVLWVIESRKSEKSSGGTDLRIVQWIIDGKPQKAMLEKRDWYLDADSGDRKIGKAKGMNAFDLAKILVNVKRIARLVDLNPDRLDEALQLAMFQKETPESDPPSSSPSGTKGTSSAGSTPAPQPSTKPEPAATGAVPDLDF